MEERIEKLEAQVANLYLDNQILKKTMNMLLDRVEFIEEGNIVQEEDMFDEGFQMHPIQQEEFVTTMEMT